MYLLIIAPLAFNTLTPNSVKINSEPCLMFNSHAIYVAQGFADYLECSQSVTYEVPFQLQRGHISKIFADKKCSLSIVNSLALL